MWNKKLSVVLLVIFSILFVGCDQASNGQNSSTSPSSKNLSKVQSWFIQENQIMTERDALSREIDYYRPPKVVRSEMLGWLDGKALIHIANVIQKEDDEKPMTSFMGSSPMKFVRNVQDIKEYGLNHPNDYKAELYVLVQTLSTSAVESKEYGKWLYIFLRLTAILKLTLIILPDKQ